jgi:uncharacterized membrane protein
MATQTSERIHGSRAAEFSRSQRTNGLLGNTSPEQVANGLGWFSIGLGLAELLAPGMMSRVVGAQERHGGLMRFLGLREIGAGIMILSGARAAGCWSRVAGDLMDLSLLGGTIGASETDKGRAIGSTAAVAGVTVLDAITAWELTQSQSGAYDVLVEKSITINKSPEECFAFWRNFENLPRFMEHLQSVRPTGDRQTHWIARGPGGVKVEWDAEITGERPNESISWRSLEGADIDNSGTVRFERAPGGRGTIVRVAMHYSPPAAGVATMVATLLGQDPEQEIAKDLRRFKQVLETGEVVKTEGQPAGRGSGATWLDTVARY